MITLIENNSAPGNIPQAIQEANKLLSGTLLYEKIAERTDPFDLATPADLLPSIVSAALKAFMHTCKVVPTKLGRKTTGAYTCTLAQRETMYLSNRSYHIDHSVGLIAGTLIHECIHALDCFSTEFGVGHGDNNSEGKENTAPYWIGNLAANMVNGTTNVKYNLMIERTEGEGELKSM